MRGRKRRGAGGVKGVSGEARRVSRRREVRSGDTVNSPLGREVFEQLRSLVNGGAYGGIGDSLAVGDGNRDMWRRAIFQVEPAIVLPRALADGVIVCGVLADGYGEALGRRDGFHKVLNGGVRKGLCCAACDSPALLACRSIRAHTSVPTLMLHVNQRRVWLRQPRATDSRTGVLCSVR